MKNTTSKRVECCPDATCPACVRRQEKAAKELRELTEATRRRQFLDSGAVELSQELEQMIALARWVLMEQDRLTIMIAAGCTREQTQAEMTIDDSERMAN